MHRQTAKTPRAVNAKRGPKGLPEKALRDGALQRRLSRSFFRYHLFLFFYRYLCPTSVGRANSAPASVHCIAAYGATACGGGNSAADRTHIGRKHLH